MTTKKTKKPTHGGARENAGAKKSTDPTTQINGRVKGWVLDWMKAEVEAGRAASVGGLVAEFVTAGVKARGGTELGKG